MSVLTRIKNNQITDSTILANTKIVPGSIVGSLFNTNLTMTSDVTITGNLTVQGSSTYLTVASTNTYVNDPLIVMNNAFTGTNTNDIGLLFNRGSDTNQAFIWDESEDEFRLIATSETGDTYGAVTTSSFANVRVGNLNVEGAAAFGSLTTTGNIGAINAILTGDLAVDGGDITTIATTFNLLTANAATVNAFTAATTLELGAETGTLTLNNPTVVGSSTTANLWNTTTTTVNAFGAATAISLGATSGTLTLNNPTVVGSSATQDLYNTTATTLNFAGAATTLNIGASTGTVAINNATIDLNGNVNINKNIDSTSTTSGALIVSGGIGIAGNVHAANVYATNLSGEILTASQPNITSVGELTSLSVAGNVTAGNVSGTNLVGTNLTGTLLTNAQPNITSVGELTSLSVAGNITAGNVTATIVSATDIESTNLSGTLLTNAQPNITSVGELTTLSVAGNVTAGNLNSNAGIAGATLSVTGDTSLGLTTAAAINNTPIGNATPSTGSFTTLLSSGVTQVTNTSTATSIGTGAFRVDGGASVSGNLWVGGNINIVGNTFTISGNSGQFFGDINGFGALYAGVTGFTPLPQTVLQLAANVNDYAQVNFENVNTGADASTDWVATAGAGDDLSHYINMGITSGNWDGTQENSLKDAVKPHDGYLYVQGNVTVPGSGGNLVIGAATADHYVKVVAGGNTAAYTVAVFDAPGTPSTNTTTGALTVIGGVGVFGNIHANNLSTGGAIDAGDLNLTGDLAVNGGDITTTATTFNLLDTTATTVNAFGDATTIDIGAATGTLTINNPTVVGTSATQDLYNTTATTLNFAGAATTLNIGADTGTATINNDTINLEGNVNVNQTTPSTNSTTGALVVDGGVGIAGNLNIGEDVVITGNLTVQGAVTTLNTATLDVEDLNITVAKGAVDSAAADGAGLTVDGANATLTYNHATTSWDLNKVTRITDTTDTTDENTGALRVAGGVAIAKDLFVGGGDIITDETTFNLLNTTATTLNIGGAATTLNLGAITGNLVINNPTVVGSQATQDLYNTTATTLNFAGAATTLNIGATTGTTNIRNALVDIDGNATVGGTLDVTGDTTLTGDLAVNGGDLTTTASDLNLFNANATKVQFAQSGTEIVIGATTGSLTINNPTVVGTQTTQNLYNTTATTVNAFGAASTLVLGDTTGTANIRNATTNIVGNAVVGGTLSVTGAVTFTDDIAVNGGDLTTTATTFNLLNSTATTLNFAGAATAVNIGATSGTTTVQNNLDVDLTLSARDINGTVIGNVTPAAATFTSLTVNQTLSARDINGTVIGNVTPAAATFTNVTDQSLTATRVTFAGTGGDLTDDANFTFASNILTIKNFSINGDTAEISVIGGSGDVILNPDVGGVIDATGSLVSNIADPQSAQDAVTLSYLQTQLNSGITTLISDDTDFTVTDDGLSEGAITANVDTISVAVMTANVTDFYSGLMTVDNNTANVSITGTAYISSTATVNGNLDVNGITTLNDSVSVTNATSSTSYDTGALQVSGGLGVAGNVSIKLGQQLTIGIEDPGANISFPERQIIALANINSAAGMQLRNLSSGNVATTNYIAVADNNVGETRVATFGIANSNFDVPGSTIKANDGYMFVNGDAPGGNLHVDVSSTDNSIYFSVGGYTTDKQVAEISSNTVSVLKDTISTSSSTGALVVAGGVGFGSNLNVSGGTVINADQTAEAFQVKGQYATTLIYADSATNTVTIGGSNTTPVSGATLRVNGTGALILPVGTTSQRPGSSGNVDVAGMMRINSSLNILEYYDGTAWQSSQGSFTVINSESFNGDGTTLEFELSGAGSTASSIVAINGIVQIPITSYSVSDTTLTFTEPPEIGDIIDVRRLTTTVSVDELSFNQNLFKANLEYAFISTGTVTPIPRLLIGTDGLVTVTGNMEIYGNLTVKGDTNGQINIGDSDTDNVAITAEINSNLVPNTNNVYDLGSTTQRWKNVYSHATVHDQTPVSVEANATPVLVDSFLTSEYSSAKYLVQVKSGVNVQIAEILLVQDSANAYITTYGVLSNDDDLGGFTANVIGANVNLYYTSTTLTNSNVKVHSTYIV